MRNGDYITLAQASKLCPGRPAIATVWRWARKGYPCRGGQRIMLKVVQAGRNIWTTPSAIKEFMTAVAAANNDHFSRQPATPRQPRKVETERTPEAQAAFAELEAQGI